MAKEKKKDCYRFSHITNIFLPKISELKNLAGFLACVLLNAFPWNTE
jgi:hypothetical protein